ncbi:MAG TPA: hypothetical protein VKG01_04520, partial [Thermoanaerobaculia bacterium]|nr:hypothetical protein [Thermoanaerobaculia bacterium]
MPWTVTMVTTGFTAPFAVLYDGVNIWVTNQGVLTSRLLRLDTTGAILQTVTVGRAPSFPVFDGANIWVPNFTDSSVSVVRASSGAVLQTLTGNSLSGPLAAAFDGQRVLITNNTGGNGASLFKAADLTPAGAFSTGDLNEPFGACSDGVNFWISLSSLNQLARF